MSLDRSLKSHGGLIRTRSVLSRAERIAQLTEEGKFDPDKMSPFGLPKVRVKHSKVGTKTKKAAEEVPAEGAPAEGAAPADGAAPAAAAKGAVPAKGAAPAKTAAPAAKAAAPAKGEKKK
ncbi:MAG: small basic protein [Phycisphaerae bacterium]